MYYFNLLNQFQGTFGKGHAYRLQEHARSLGLLTSAFKCLGIHSDKPLVSRGCQRGKAGGFAVSVDICKAVWCWLTMQRSQEMELPLDSVAYAFRYLSKKLNSKDITLLCTQCTFQLLFYSIYRISAIFGYVAGLPNVSTCLSGVYFMLRASKIIPWRLCQFSGGIYYNNEFLTLYITYTCVYIAFVIGCLSQREHSPVVHEVSSCLAARPPATSVILAYVFPDITVLNPSQTIESTKRQGRGFLRLWLRVSPWPSGRHFVCVLARELDAILEISKNF